MPKPEPIPAASSAWLPMEPAAALGQAAVAAPVAAKPSTHVRRKASTAAAATQAALQRRSSAAELQAAATAHEQMDAWLAHYFQRREEEEQQELAALAPGKASGRKGAAGGGQWEASGIPAGLRVGPMPTYSYDLQRNEQCLLSGPPRTAAGTPKRNLVLAAVGDAFDAAA